MIRKKKTCNGCGKSEYIKSYKLCVFCYNNEAAKFERAKQKGTTSSRTLKQWITGVKSNKIDQSDIHKLIPFQALKDKLWAVTSLYVRMLKSDDDGNANCISCGVYDKWNHFDCGHYHKAELYPSVRYELDNLHPQCVECNRGMEGNLKKYKPNLIEKIGQERFNELEKLANSGKYLERDEIRTLLSQMKHKLKELKREKP